MGERASIDKTQRIPLKRLKRKLDGDKMAKEIDEFKGDCSRPKNTWRNEAMIHTDIFATILP